MLDLVKHTNRIPAITDAALEKVCQLQTILKDVPQRQAVTSHLIHGGIYSRTLRLEADSWLVGAIVKIPTTLIVQGDVVVYVNGERVPLNGYNVFAASAHRKQALYAKTETYLTMSFPTDAKSVEEAEEQFTDEFGDLCSRRPDALNQITITGE